jgi:hypothetical protein
MVFDYSGDKRNALLHGHIRQPDQSGVWDFVQIYQFPEVGI